ncbi:FAD/NAD(P)-binding protein [Microbacterium oleivorans]|uniref:FAD/NAD(P)-binding protein n=1 Tax=Microbacterium oleivorans TaxID=273677 RepID=A0A7D5ISA5_9MICO|nr:FAD/NAD(P)-binding protein [Microbacterium oleivorans]QLD13281.1 FAD/NAD(P)-binding protein [Microbacterium oleivorans]
MGGAGAANVRRLVIVGAGPRAIMLLERIVARSGEAVGTSDARAVGAPRLHVELIDPHPPGAGRIWRRAQSPLLKLNSMARDVTVFTDDSCTIDGPIRPGPSLIEWAELWRSGELAATGRGIEIDDEVAAAEARGLRGDSFPTRRLHSYYLEWFYRRTVAEAPSGVTVRWRADTVARVSPENRVTLASGLELDADGIVYALGHTGREPDAATAALIDAARSERLQYVPPAFTADADLSQLGAGDDVIVRGMGLAAVDLVVLLTQGRGGRFVDDDDGVLRYVASGREPRLHLGSRRGVPYRSKVSSAIQGDAPQREVLTAAAIAELVARPGLIDFEADVWPLIAGELLHGHYRELFTGHPDRVVGDWPTFRTVLQSHAWDDPALLEAIAATVPDPLDRFDVASLDRPLAAAAFADRDDAHERVRAHIVTDLHLRTTPERSAAQGVFLAALLSYLALADVPAERWNERSRAVSLPVRWHTFFSYVASGPPAHRLEEFLALADAGVLRFLGPDIDVRVDPGRGFVASSPRVPGETVARSLVDAWLPGSGAAHSDNPVLRALARRQGSAARVLTDADGRVVTAEGVPTASVFALGPFTSLPESGAFTRPGSNALSIRQTDRTAGAIVAAVLDAAVPLVRVT